jgi:hypothetical protein
MPKDLTTKERNEIIGLAIDLAPEVYNNYLNNFVDNSICGRGKLDAPIAAAIICVATWGDSDEPYGYADDFKSDGKIEHYRWHRIIMEAHREDSNELCKIDINVFNSEEKAKKFINGV